MSLYGGGGGGGSGRMYPPGQHMVRTYPKVVSRAGHATTLPRQRDHVFRPKKLLFIALCPC